MKVLMFAVYVIFLVAACNDPNVVDPIDNDPVDDPVDTTEMDPVDTKLLEIKNKWEGEYTGTITTYKYSSFSETIYDTLYNQKITITEFKRRVDYPTLLDVTLVRNETTLDTSYFGWEHELLSDSAVLMKSDGGFSDSFSKITLNQADSSLTTYYSYGHIYGGTVSNGYFKRI